MSSTEEPVVTTEVRLTYTITGSKAQVQPALRTTLLDLIPRLMQVHKNEITSEARFIGLDFDPGEHCSYRNYETFLVALFLNNDAGRHAWCASRTDWLASLPTADPDRPTRVALADTLKEYVEGPAELDLDGLDPRTNTRDREAAGLMNELLDAALGNVDWLGLADEWLATRAEAGG